MSGRHLTPSFVNILYAARTARTSETMLTVPSRESVNLPHWSTFISPCRFLKKNERKTHDKTSSPLKRRATICCDLLNTVGGIGSQNGQKDVRNGCVRQVGHKVSSSSSSTLLTRCSHQGYLWPRDSGTGVGSSWRFTSWSIHPQILLSASYNGGTLWEGMLAH